MGKHGKIIELTASTCGKNCASRPSGTPERGHWRRGEGTNHSKKGRWHQIGGQPMVPRSGHFYGIYLDLNGSVNLWNLRGYVWRSPESDLRALLVPWGVEYRNMIIPARCHRHYIGILLSGIPWDTFHCGWIKFPIISQHICNTAWAAIGNQKKRMGLVGFWKNDRNLSKVDFPTHPSPEVDRRGMQPTGCGRTIIPLSN